MGKRDYDGQLNYLISMGCSDVKEYCLVNNFGYTFNLDGSRYDLRYWANCYGCELNYWSLDCKSGKPKIIEDYFNENFN